MRKNEISRNVWTLFESAKEAASTGLTQAVASNQLKIDRALLPTVIAIFNDAVDRSFSNGFKSVERSIDKVISDAGASRPASAVAPSRKKTKKN